MWYVKLYRTKFSNNKVSVTYALEIYTGERRVQCEAINTDFILY